MPIPPEFIHELNARADLVELIAPYVKLQRNGANWVGLCPFHQEKTPSFTVQQEKGFYHCFGCGAHGNAIGFLQKNSGLDFLDAVEKLAAMQGMEVPRQGGKSGAYRRRPDNSELLAAAVHYYRRQLAQNEAAIAYLKNRGLSGETAALYKIGYAPNEWEGLKQTFASKEKALIEVGLLRKKDDKTYDYFRNRIIFPILDSNSRVCGFGGRALSDEDLPKYLNSSESAFFSKRRLLYGLPQAMKAARQNKRLVICEGYMDVVMLAQAGFPEAVATMGTAATAEQMRIATRYAANIYLAYDGDSAGEKGAFRAMQAILPALKDGISIFFLFLPPGQDPDSYVSAHGVEGFVTLLEQATSLGDYLIQALARYADAVSAEGQATGMIREGARLLQQIDARSAPAWRKLLQQKLEQHTGIPLAAVAGRQQAIKPRESGAVMPPQSLLYQLLCCLSRQPALAEKLPQALPLVGAAQDAEIIATVLEKLRWEMNDEADVPTLLSSLGHERLARQLRRSLNSRYAHTKDVALEIKSLVDRLQQKHEQLTRPGKQAWLDKLKQQ